MKIKLYAGTDHDEAVKVWEGDENVALLVIENDDGEILSSHSFVDPQGDHEAIYPPEVDDE